MAAVVKQQAGSTRYARAFGLFALLAGIVAMHALVIGMSGMPHGGPTTGGSPVMAQHSPEHGMAELEAMLPEITAPAVLMAVAGPAPAAMVANHCADGGCGGDHSGMHACVFVLAALLLGLGLALLAWIGLARGDTANPKVRMPRAAQARPPPWTVPSLAELSILRI